MPVFESFMTINSKRPTIPGGHAVSIVGYSLPYQQFLIKNSFVSDWGENGYCWMPFDYFNQYVFEKWIFDIPEL